MIYLILNESRIDLPRVSSVGEFVYDDGEVDQKLVADFILVRTDIHKYIH